MACARRIRLHPLMVGTVVSTFVTQLAGEPLYSCMHFLNAKDDELPIGCAKAERPDFEVASTKKWTSVIGIGPAKSGTSSIGPIIKASGTVIVGNKNIDDKNGHWQSELTWLSRESEMREGLKTLSHYFQQNVTGGGNTVDAYWEKDPQYFQEYAPYAAYRARTFLGPYLKLVHTSRDLLDLDGSLYLFREAFNAGVSYRTWVETRIAVFESHMQCRNATFSQLIIPSFDGAKIGIEELQNPDYFSWETASTIEAYLYRACGSGKPRYVDHVTDSMVGIFLVPNLRRWMHAFPNRSNIFCMDVAHRIADRPKTYKRLYTFLGLEGSSVFAGTEDNDDKHEHELTEAPPQPRLMLEPDVPDSKRLERDGVRHPDKATLDRLIESQEAFEGVAARQVVEKLREMISELAPRYIRCDDVFWYENVCGYIPTGYEYCYPN